MEKWLGLGAKTGGLDGGHVYGESECGYDHREYDGQTRQDSQRMRATATERRTGVAAIAKVRMATARMRRRRTAMCGSPWIRWSMRVPS